MHLRKRAFVETRRGLAEHVFLAESKREQIGVFEHEAQTHALGLQLTDVIALLPGNFSLNLVAEDLVTVRLGIAFQRETVCVLNFDPDTASLSSMGSIFEARLER